MNREETKRAIEMMQAYGNGKEIEICRKGCTDWRQFTPEDEWDFATFVYRIKPQSSYRPYANVQEVLKDKKIHGDMMVLKSRTEAISIHYIADAYMVIVGTICKTIPYDEALKEFTWEDGTPFGVKEE